MGIYLNPTNGMEKQDFLFENGKLMTVEDLNAIEEVEEDCEEIPVILVDNVGFLAAMVLNVNSELEYAKEMLATEKRPFIIFLVPAEKLQDHIA